MTMPTSQPVRTVALPEPGYPMLTRMITNALFPEGETHTVACPHCKGTLSVDKGKEEPLTWIVSKAHPLIPNMKVMRMFVDRGGVEVYSVSDDGKTGMRNLVPMSWVRLTEEAMPLDVFVEELEAAEHEDDGEPDPGDPDPAPGPDPEPAPQANGQNVS